MSEKDNKIDDNSGGLELLMLSEKLPFNTHNLSSAVREVAEQIQSESSITKNRVKIKKIIRQHKKLDVEIKKLELKNIEKKLRKIEKSYSTLEKNAVNLISSKKEQSQQMLKPLELAEYGIKLSKYYSVKELSADLGMPVFVLNRLANVGYLKREKSKILGEDAIRIKKASNDFISLLEISRMYIDKKDYKNHKSKTVAYIISEKRFIDVLENINNINPALSIIYEKWTLSDEEVKKYKKIVKDKKEVKDRKTVKDKREAKDKNHNDFYWIDPNSVDDIVNIVEKLENKKLSCYMKPETESETNKKKVRKMEEYVSLFSLVKSKLKLIKELKEKYPEKNNKEIRIASGVPYIPFNLSFKKLQSLLELMTEEQLSKAPYVNKLQSGEESSYLIKKGFEDDFFKFMSTKKQATHTAFVKDVGSYYLNQLREETNYTSLAIEVMKRNGLIVLKNGKILEDQFNDFIEKTKEYVPLTQLLEEFFKDTAKTKPAMKEKVAFLKKILYKSFESENNLPDYVSLLSINQNRDYAFEKGKIAQNKHTEYFILKIKKEEFIDDFVARLASFNKKTRRHSNNNVSDENKTGPRGTPDYREAINYVFDSYVNNDGVISEKEESGLTRKDIIKIIKEHLGPKNNPRSKFIYRSGVPENMQIFFDYSPLKGLGFRLASKSTEK